MPALSGLERNAIKYIAVAAMIIDHAGAFFIPITTPLGLLCRIVGRITAPVMCFFLAEGFAHTSAKGAYALRLGVFAVLAQWPYAALHAGQTAALNMLCTLFICFCVLLAYTQISELWLRLGTLAALVVLSQWADWGVIAPCWVLGFYIWRGDKNRQAIWFSAVSVFFFLTWSFNAVAAGAHWYAQLWQLGVFLFLPLLYAYNGDSGKKTLFNKWFFYVIYPLHLALIAALRAL